MRIPVKIAVATGCAGLALGLSHLLIFTGLQTAAFVLASLMFAQWVSATVATPLREGLEDLTEGLVVSALWIALWYAAFFIFVRQRAGSLGLWGYGWMWDLHSKPRPRFISAGICMLFALPFTVRTTVRAVWRIGDRRGNT